MAIPAAPRSSSSKAATTDTPTACWSRQGRACSLLVIRTSAGVPAEFIQHTLVLDFNELDAVAQAFERYGNEIACVIVEPVAGNMNLVKPAPGFLKGCVLCSDHGALLIFDEVMTGFRVGPQGVQGLTGVIPDITTLAKVIGGGMPVGAFGGRADIMEHIAPIGGVYQAGTLSGNPVAVAAGLATLELLAEPGFYDRLQEQTRKLTDGLAARPRRWRQHVCRLRGSACLAFTFATRRP